MNTQNNSIAVMSDVHGNRWALQAVLRDIEVRRIQKIVNLGDCLYGPLDPAGTARILMQLKAPTVRGNEDRIVAESSDEIEDSATLDFVRDNLSAEQLNWLSSLERTTTIGSDLLLFHGTPERDDEYLLRAVNETDVSLRSSDELAGMLSHVDAPVILCGHDHIPGTVTLPDDRLVVNPGSVGLQAYTDDRPFPHVMQTGSPQARYAVLSRSSTGWHVEDIAVTYNWRAASEEALKNGRPDWAAWLRMGKAAMGL